MMSSTCHRDSRQQACQLEQGRVRTGRMPLSDLPVLLALKD
jgi:hypothetical protein